MISACPEWQKRGRGDAMRNPKHALASVNRWRVTHSSYWLCQNLNQAPIGGGQAVERKQEARYGDGWGYPAAAKDPRC